MNILNYLKDLFVSRSPSKDLRNASVVKNPKAIKEDRWAALLYFQDHPEITTSVEALLPRFEYSLENGILDTREKELAMKGILRFGGDAIPILQKFILGTSRIAWPIKILKSIANEDVIIDSLFETLNFSDTTFDESQIDKNYDILCHLLDYKIGQRWKKLVHFLNDPDERVRFAVVEVFLEQPFQEVSEILERVLQNSSQDNSRIRQTLINKYIENGWKLNHPEAFPNNHVVDSVYVSKEKTLEFR